MCQAIQISLYINISEKVCIETGEKNQNKLCPDLACQHLSPHYFFFFFFHFNQQEKLGDTLS